MIPLYGYNIHMEMEVVVSENCVYIPTCSSSHKGQIQYLVYNPSLSTPNTLMTLFSMEEGETNIIKPINLKNILF